VPVLMETKTLQIQMPPSCDQVAPILKHPDKCKCTVTLPAATIVDLNLTGRRQWLRIQMHPSDSDGWVDCLFEHLKIPRPKTVMVSRYRTDFQGKVRVPLRLFEPDMTPTNHRLRQGDVVQCAISELRAYEREGRQCCGELYRDMILVKKSKKRSRPKAPLYFSDGE